MIIKEKEYVSDNSDNDIQYIQKELMTDCEKRFFDALQELEIEEKIRINPQVNLATIINKIKINSRYCNELFRNIDFEIFNEDYSKLLILIEINDSTHKQIDRIKRDKKVKNICEKANIKLITFHTKYPNEKEYIKNRVRNEINNIKINL